MPASAVNGARYRDGRRENMPLERISDVRPIPRRFVWVEAVRAGRRASGLHELAIIEGANNARQRPKLESFGNTLFIAAYTGQHIDGHVRFGETHLFHGERFLVSVRHGGSLPSGAQQKKADATHRLSTKWRTRKGERGTLAHHRCACPANARRAAAGRQSSGAQKTKADATHRL